MPDSEKLEKLEEAHKLTAKAHEFWDQGRFAETGPPYEQAAAIINELFGPNSTEYAAALRNVANLRYVQEQYSEAAELYQRTLEIMEPALGPAHESLVDPLTWLAESYFKNQQYDEAEEPFKRAIAILEQRGEPALERLADACMNLAHLYYFVGRHPEAEPQYLRALSIREQVLGPDDLEVAHSAEQLARMYHLHFESDRDPEPLLLRALSITRKVLGEDHPDTAERLYRLGDFYRSHDRTVEAEPLYEKAMAILDLHPELDQFQTGWMRSGYAEFLRETGREDQAAELEKSWGEWNSFEEMCRAEVRTRETTFGPDSPELATSLEHLANTLLFNDNYDEAEKLYQRALSIREAALGPDDCSIPNSLKGLANICRMRDQYALSEELIQRAARISEACFGKDSVEYARLQEHLAVNTGLRQPERAEELYELAVSTYRKVEGAESREYAEGLFNFGRFYTASRQFEKAERVLLELMQLSEKEIDVADLEKADYFQLYAGVLQELGRTEEAAELLKRVEEIWAQDRSET